MATRDSIQMDFDKANRQADELDDIADSVDREANRSLMDTLTALGGSWRGENANLYMKKGFALKENINATAGSLRQAASTVRYVAQRIYEAEMENLRIAEEREEAERRAEEERRLAQERAKSSHSGGGGGFRA